MSNQYPLSSNAFSGGARLTAQQQSEGAAAAAPLYELMNSAAVSAEAAAALSASTNYETATAAVVAAANRQLTTNIGAARTVTLPDFATAPAGWEHTFISLDAFTNELTIAVDTGGTINGVAGNIVLTTTNHEWVKIMKVSGATGWLAIGGTAVTPA